MARLIRMALTSAMIAALLAPASAGAQTTPVARLLVTVVDPTGAVVPNATVTVVGTEPATKAATVDPIKTTAAGQGTLEKLVPGRYTIRAEFPGFGPGELKDQRLRAGDNKHVVVLPLRRIEDSVVVGRDARDVATDRTLVFGSALTREQIQALSDDPDEMRRQLQEMAGPDAVIRVDSFEGQQLPPKAQIKSIRISRDQFAAENHGAFSHIDIITQPGVGPMRTSARLGFYDSGLDGRNPLVAARGPGQQRNFGGTFGGTLIKERADFSVSINGSNNWSTPQLYAATTGGTRAENLNLRMPMTNTSYSGLLNYALTKDQTLRLGVSGGTTSRRNQGVGQYDLIERAYETEGTNFSLRAQESGPLGRRFVTNTRFMLNVNKSTNRSTVEAPTVVVQDAFTSGGAQRAGGGDTRTFVFQQDLDYIRGIHSWRGGVMLDGGYFKTDTSTNYLGTYTFESLEAYEAGRPRSYTRRLGDPTLSYWNVQTGLFIQDDIRFKRTLSVSLGLRYEGQMHIQKQLNLAPRAGFTWSPLQSGRMSVRASWGIFYDWFSPGTYAQTLQTDPSRQREVNLINPAYPDPGNVTATSVPTNRYLLDDALRLPRNQRMSAGVSGSIKRLSLGATYTFTRGTGLLVGDNLNAPVNGVRPDPAFANIIRAVSAAETRQHNVSGNIGVSLSPTGPPAPGAAQRFFSWRRGLNVFTFFGISDNRNNTEGAFAVPATGDLAEEWGTVGSRYNTNVSISSSMIRNLNVNFNVGMSGGPRYTIRTGTDDNGDLIFNDRPTGVARGTAKGTAFISSYLNFNYSIGFGQQTAASAPQGIMVVPVGGGMTASMLQGSAAPRYRVNFSVQIENPTNRANYTGYSGVMTSPFFMKPTSATGVRRVTFNMGLSF